MIILFVCIGLLSVQNTQLSSTTQLLLAQMFRCNKIIWLTYYENHKTNDQKIGIKKLF